MTEQFAAMFDQISELYDQSGVAFFQTIAAGLVRELAPQPGERVLDIGSGRGAATFPLAEAVGPFGTVDALDIAPGMARLLSEDVAARGLDHVHVSVGDAADPHPPGTAYDVVASSLVVFFLPDPAGALTRWTPLLREGGRLGITTFATWGGPWRELSELGQRLSGGTGPQRGGTDFDTDEGVEVLLTGAGLSGVRTVPATYPVLFADLEQFKRWAVGTMVGALWSQTPPERHAEVDAEVRELLDRHRRDDGLSDLPIDVRYTLGVR